VGIPSSGDVCCAIHILELTVTGISGKAVPAAWYDIGDVQEYTSSPSSHEPGGGANDKPSWCRL